MLLVLASKSPLSFPYFIRTIARKQLRKNRSWRHCDRSYYVTQVRFPPPHLLHLEFVVLDELSEVIKSGFQMI
ncbi:hypothetical protein CKAN_00650300 [Cinnamomum micranthum f. kanehirae]|uniref:Uncharacterized protein n=1 Tax=Cinnamomum micranthum f. kanehirae TaxID=337451 RepID=A0A3S3NED9_9MAGN|nr:hypothetical protein CKAN_00650300 [Cinnamomum micranthum f. kanehirae]